MVLKNSFKIKNSNNRTTRSISVPFKMALDSDERTLYVANLHKNVSEELLYELFLQAGPIERVNIPTTNSKNFRYGFVTYLHERSIDYAIQLYKGTCLFKKELLIKRKGEKNNDQETITSDRYIENINLESNQDQSLNIGQYLPQYLSSNENCNSGKPNLHSPNVMQSSLKGHWSDRSRPYSHYSRIHYSSRTFDSRDRQRNHDYSKPYRGRKGRY